MSAGSFPALPRFARGTAAALLLLGFATGAAIIVTPGGHSASAGIDRCRAPEAIAALTEKLPRVAGRLREGGTLTIVALGSSSTSGTGASRPENTYPSRLATLLTAHFPALEVQVLNRGIAGEEAPAMAARIGRDVLPADPDLVIWQVGTNGLLRGDDPGHIMEVVRDGITRMKTAGIDVMLMDPQYAPAVLQHEAYREVLYGLAAVAHAEDVPLFRRFALMRSWAEEGQMPLPVMVSRDRLHMTDASYDCLARQLAATIAHATGDALPL